MNKPLEKYSLFQTSDADEAREIVSRVYCDHTLKPRRSGPLDACHHRARLSSVSVNYMQYGTDISVEPGLLKRFFLFQLPLEGAAEITTNHKEFTTGVGRASVINPTDYTKMLWNRDCKKLMVQIRVEAMEMRLSRLLMRPIDTPILFDSCIMTDNRLAHGWWQQIKHLASDLDHGFDPWRSRYILEDTERHLLTNLLYSFNHNYMDRLLAQEVQAAPKHVKRAEDYIHAHLKGPLSIDDLVVVTGVSQRSIFEGFRSFRGTTPMKYVLQLRLERVHKELLRAGPERNVTDIALKWGFNQLGRFSVSYKKVYGESPSDTLKK
ncbi:MAG: AraC family transcriptional regulator [Alphaproteobacteria bacterium]|nr:AraC family transcriptional regulator [Alphaproteobacteria bacterium]